MNACAIAISLLSMFGADEPPPCLAVGWDAPKEWVATVRWEHASYLNAVEAWNAEVARQAAVARSERLRAPARVTTANVPSGGFPAVMLRIRACESGGNYNAKNPRSTASGGWQFLDSTFTAVTGLAPPARAYSREVQDAAAMKLYREQGTRPWNASRHCWGAP